MNNKTGIIEFLKSNSYAFIKSIGIASLIIMILVSFNACGNSVDSETAQIEALQSSLEALKKSCHSTEEHISDVYTYDFDHNNYIDENELSLFVNAHPKLYNDTRFTEWVEGRLRE